MRARMSVAAFATQSTYCVRCAGGRLSKYGEQGSRLGIVINLAKMLSGATPLCFPQCHSSTACASRSPGRRSVMRCARILRNWQARLEEVHSDPDFFHRLQLIHSLVLPPEFNIHSWLTYGQQLRQTRRNEQAQSILLKLLGLKKLPDNPR